MPQSRPEFNIPSLESVSLGASQAPPPLPAGFSSLGKDGATALGANFGTGRPGIEPGHSYPQM